MLNDLDHARFVALLRYFDDQIERAERELERTKILLARMNRERTKILLARMSRARDQLSGWSGGETLLEHVEDECDSISRAEIMIAEGRMKNGL